MDKHCVIAGGFHKLIKDDTDTQARHGDVWKVELCGISNNAVTFRQDIGNALNQHL